MTHFLKLKFQVLQLSFLLFLRIKAQCMSPRRFLFHLQLHTSQIKKGEDQKKKKKLPCPVHIWLKIHHLKALSFRVYFLPLNPLGGRQQKAKFPQKDQICRTSAGLLLQSDILSICQFLRF